MYWKYIFSFSLKYVLIFLKLFSPMAVFYVIRHMANDTCCVFNQIDKLVSTVVIHDHQSK